MISKPRFLVAPLLSFFTIMLAVNAIAQEGVYIFSGEDVLQYKHPKTLETYTIDFKLRTTALLTEPPIFTETTPPMPFLMGGVSTYLRPEGYMLVLRNDEGETVVSAIVGTPAEFTRVTIASAPDGIFVYVNGGEVFRTSATQKLGQNWHIGKGFNNRFWSGEFEYFDVYDKLRVSGEFQPDAERFDPEARAWTLQYRWPLTSVPEAVNETTGG